MLDSTVIRTATALLAVGLSIKVALFPLHLWLPSALHRSSRLCATCHDVSNPMYLRQPDGSYALTPLDERCNLPLGGCIRRPLTLTNLRNTHVAAGRRAASRPAAAPRQCGLNWKTFGFVARLATSK